MVQYIDKSTTIAKIKEIYNEDYKFLPSDIVESVRDFKDDLLTALDTLEVQEVDLEKEAELIANDIMIGVQANRYNTVVYNTKRCDFNHSHLMLAARKGIEIGLKAQKGK